MDTQGTLSIFAEVFVALAGFSGIAIAVGRRQLGSLSRLDRRRLTNLFVLAGLGLVQTLFILALLHAEGLEASSLWRAASAASVAVVGPWLVWDVVQVTRLDPAERRDVNLLVLVLFDLMAVGMLVLLVVNTLLWAQAWPFFVAMAGAVLGALQQFVLLVRWGIRGGSGA